MVCESPPVPYRSSDPYRKIDYDWQITRALWGTVPAFCLGALGEAPGLKHFFGPFRHFIAILSIFPHTLPHRVRTPGRRGQADVLKLLDVQGLEELVEPVPYVARILGGSKCVCGWVKVRRVRSGHLAPQFQ